MGRPSKLTPAIQETICGAISTIVPMHWAFRYAGVTDQTMRNWRATATAAEAKKSSQRSQHERRCIEFFGAVDRVRAEAKVRGANVIESAAAPSRLIREVTTTRTKGEATVTTTVREEKEIAGDWRAMAHLMARVYPEEMGDHSTVQVIGEESEPVRGATIEEVMEELEAFRRARAARGIARQLGVEQSPIDQNEIT